MPDSIVPTSKRKAEALFLYGLDNPNYKEQKNKWRWGSNPNTHLLDDFKALMVFLYTDESYEEID
ncbi:MAG: hypothetical protein U5K55_05250 [Aliarcobacter sp.]|nr:hypothetical protein [Aliarcobacter sp.]